MHLKYLDRHQDKKKSVEWWKVAHFQLHFSTPPIKEFGKNSNKWNHMIVSSQPSGFVLPRSFSEDLIKERRGPGGVGRERLWGGQERGAGHDSQSSNVPIVRRSKCLSASAHGERVQILLLMASGLASWKLLWWPIKKKKKNHQIIEETIPLCFCFWSDWLLLLFRQGGTFLVFCKKGYSLFYFTD